MDSKGLLLNLSSLRRELQDRKSARSRLDPLSERMKRAASPTLLDLHKLRQEIAASNYVSPSPIKKPPVAYCMPANRKELVAQYPKRGDSLTLKPVPGYKKDAAALLVDSLKRHFNKFFFVWKRHTDDIRRDTVRKETMGKRSVHSRENAGEFEVKARGGSPERMYIRRKDAGKLGGALPPDTLSSELYSDAVDDHLAMVSNISHPDIASDRASPETPRKTSPSDPTITSIVQGLRSKPRTPSPLQTSSIQKLVDFLTRKLVVQYQSVISALLFRLNGSQGAVSRLVVVISKVAVRPYWETLRDETVKAMVFQLFTVSVQKLTRVFTPVLELVFSKLRQIRSVPKPRKPGITLKSALQRVVTQRWQAAFNTTKRYADRQQTRIEDYYTSLKRCLLICDLARIKALAKHFSRLRVGQVAANKPEPNYPKSRVSVGLRVISQVISSAKYRDIRECVAVLRLNSERIYIEIRRKQGAAALIPALLRVRRRVKAGPFQLMHKDFNSAELLRIGKAVMTKLQVKFNEGVKILLQANIEKWHKRVQKPSAMNSPEAPRFAKILQGQVTKRIKWSFGALKELLPMKEPVVMLSDDKKAAAMAVGYVLKGIVGKRLGRRVEDLRGNYSGIEGKSHIGFESKAKSMAAKVIFQWAINQEIRVRKSILQHWKSQIVPFRIFAGAAKIGHFYINHSAKRWKCAVFSQRNVERGVEILSRLLRKKLEKVVRRLEPFQTEKSVSALEAAMLPPMQSMKLRVCLQHLRRREMITKLGALRKWGGWAVTVKLREAEKASQGVAALFGLVEAVRGRETVARKYAMRKMAAY